MAAGDPTSFTGWLTGDDTMDTKGELVPFDPRFYGRQTRLFRDWTGARNTQKEGYANWLKEFQATEPEFKANVEAENTFTKWLRDGGFSASLAGLRTRERAADEVGLKNALDYADAGNNASKIFSGANTGTSSSADYARRLRSGGRISSEFAGRDVARERADLGNEINIKLATEGRINANLDRLLSRKLLPSQLSTQQLNELTAALNAIGSGTQFGAQPKFWEDKSYLEHAGAFTQGVGDTYYGGGARAGAYQPSTQPVTAAPAYTPSPYAAQSYVAQNPTGGYGGYGVSYAPAQPYAGYAPNPTSTSGYPSGVSYDVRYAPEASSAGSWMSYGG